MKIRTIYKLILISLFTLSSSALAGVNLVTNPGFEDGFNNVEQPDGWWNVSNNNTVAGAAPAPCPNVTIICNIPPHSGDFSLGMGQFGPTASLTFANGGNGYVFQDLVTSIGARYTINFYLSNRSFDNLDTFDAYFGNINLLHLVNPGNFNWTLKSYTVSATSLLSRLEFDARNDNNYFSIDDISVFLAGPDPLNTQSSMQYQASQLRSAFNTQTVAANFALNYDCNVFDVKGLCISAGGRYITIDNPNINNSAAVVTLGYKVNPNIRIGAYLDQNIHISNPTGINISNNTPLMGLYAVWNKEQSGLGFQIRLANTYQDKDISQTRTIFDTSEAGSGKSSLQSQSYLAELSYAFQYQDKTLVRPYAGLRYTHLKQDGYTEATVIGSVEDPLTVASLKDKSATALLGVKVQRSLTDKATLTAQLGLEQDLHHKVGNYSATDLNASDLTAIAFNSNIKRTRPAASLGAFYDVTKTQRASATINYQQTPFQSTGSTTAYFNYMIGF
jgi:hypothetical protein